MNKFLDYYDYESTQKGKVKFNGPTNPEDDEIFLDDACLREVMEIGSDPAQTK